jgi:hypothetical protein
MDKDTHLIYEAYVLEEGMLDWFKAVAVPKIIEHRGKLSSIATLVSLLGAMWGVSPDVAEQLINASDPETINSVVAVTSHLDPTYSGPEIGLNPDDTYGANQYPQASTTSPNAGQVSKYLDPESPHYTGEGGLFSSDDPNHPSNVKGQAIPRKSGYSTDF